MAQQQGRERTNIDPSIIEAVKNEFKKERYTDPDDITWKRVRRYLKSLQGRYKQGYPPANGKCFNQYYEHSMRIAIIISGRPPPVMTAEEQAIIQFRFMQCQLPFELCPASIRGRSNFLSYPFCINKILEMENLHQYRDRFPLLKSKQPRINHERVWKWICDYNDWLYKPSMVFH